MQTIWANIFKLVTSAVLLRLTGNPLQPAKALKTTAKLISTYNYPVEEHTVYTTDGYILSVYRIPSSPRLLDTEQPEDTVKPIVFFQHGIFGTSDDWILNGPKTSLAFLFADAGYDVWLGNARGNTYSRQHKHISTKSSDFWNFTWHEIGVYDLAAMLDYILHLTHQSSLHFVAHSQGTTTYFVLISMHPQYNEKMKTVHLLAPVIFSRYQRFLLAKVAKWFIWYPSFINMIFGAMEVLPAASVPNIICDYICSTESILKFLCSGMLDFIGGWGTTHFNHDLLMYVCKTHPAGASTSQIIHYLQIFKSGDFHQYDHGMKLNRIYYQQETPPAYNLSNAKNCVHLYYSNNDCLVDTSDVEYLATKLPCADLYRIPYDDWNHHDFLWSINVKEVINDKIIDITNYSENKYSIGI